MKTMRAVLSGVGVLALLALATTFASAGDTDCTFAASACGFGALQGGDTTTGTLTGNGHDVSFTENVFLNASGVYTYVFQLTNNNGAGGGLDLANSFTNASGGGFGDNFNCLGSCLNWGVVNGGISATSNVDDTSFVFNPLSLTVNFATLASGQNFTFYVQGAAPTTGTLNAGNGGSTQNSSNVLAPVSEPGVVALLGSSVLLFGGILFGGRLRSRKP